MTGTADTKPRNFTRTYKLERRPIPTNQDDYSVDHQDVVYKTEKEKFCAVFDEIMEYHERGQPILVGTTSVEKSNAISTMLARKRFKHEVLNAKHHENEAFIVAQAGVAGRDHGVSTNMAGRGTDIVLGGNPEMIAKLEFSRERAGSPIPSLWASRVVEPKRRICKKEARRESVELGGCTSSAPNATNRGASTTSFAGAQDARATRVRAGSICRSKTN